MWVFPSFVLHLVSSLHRQHWRTIAVFVAILLAEIGFCMHFDLGIQDAGIVECTDTLPTDTLPNLAVPVDPVSPARLHDSIWARIDAHALPAPADVEDSAHTLARYLCAPAKNDREKARAIYRWIADRIGYDDAAYNRGRYGLADVTTIFKSHLGVCEDYANLFDLLCTQVGIPSKKIIGFSKGFSTLVSKNSLEPDHAWNAVYLDSAWHVLDVTWAAGYGQMRNGLLHTTKRFEGYWFCTPPEEFVCLHLPSERRWQLLDQPLSLGDFECLPQVAPEYFKLGYPVADLLAEMRAGRSHEVARVFTHPFDVQVVAAPAAQHLDLGDSLQLQFVCHDCQAMTAQTAGRLIDFERQDSLFCLDIQPKKGPLRVFARKRKTSRRYDGILEWVVR